MGLSDKMVVDQMRPDILMQQGGRYHPKYFASNQGLVFVGGYLIDEIISIQYVLRQSKRPVYSYSSMYYDAVAGGQVLVEGNLTCNYIDSAYLYYALYHTIVKNYTKDKGARQVTGYQAALQAIGAIDSRNKELVKTLSSLASQSSLSQRGTQIPSPQVKQLAQLIASDPDAGRRVITMLKQRFWGNLATDSQATRNGFGRNLRITDFGGKVAADTANWENAPTTLYARPDQVPPVNLVISHGNPMDKNFSTARVLREVDFLGNQMSVVASGAPQAETYPFFARTVEF